MNLKAGLWKCGNRGPSFPQPLGCLVTSFFRLKAGEQLSLGLLHGACGGGVAFGLSGPSKGLQSLSRLEISGGLGQPPEHLPRSGIAAVDALLLALGVGHQFGLSAGAVEIRIGIEVLLIETLGALGVGGRDMPIAQVLADHGSVLTLHQPLVVGVPRPRTWSARSVTVQ